LKEEEMKEELPRCGRKYDSSFLEKSNVDGRSAGTRVVNGRPAMQANDASYKQNLGPNQ
jgi:hypothetical protein